MLRVARLVLAMAAALFSAGAAGADALDNYVRAEMEKRKIPALAVGVLRDGKVLAQRAYGQASLELNVPAKLDTVYGLNNMTSVFTAAAIMVLIRDGRIGLDDPVGKVLPELPESWRPV